MSCSTCHIILDPDSFKKLGPPCEAECDMLDLAFEPTDTSRLGCQVKVKEDKLIRLKLGNKLCQAPK